MRKILFAALFITASLRVLAQTPFTATLTGTPLNTTGWTVASGSSVVGNTLQLTTNATNQSGYVYYSTPVNLAACSQFTATFDFQVTNSSSPPADGIAFWYISNPPSAFIAGGGIGLPTNPNGLVFIMDTYDNDANNNNPLLSLRYMNGTFNYVEGSTTGLIVPDVTFQSFITNTAWHTCVINYNNGAITVAFDGNPPSMTGTYALTLNGYFGFSASTGALYSKHTIRNVSITGTIPPPAPTVVSPLNICQNTGNVTLSATGTNLRWYTVATGGTASLTAPTVGTAMATADTFYVSQFGTGVCESVRSRIIVNIAAQPAPPTATYTPTYCGGDPFVPFNVTGTNLKWYATPSGGTGSTTAPVVNTLIPGSYNYYVSQTPAGCESNRTPISVLVYPGVKSFYTYNVKYGCAADTVVFTNHSLGIGKYQWTFGDGGSDTAANVTHVYYGHSSFNAQLQIKSGNCTDVSTQAIDLSHPLAASFTVDHDSICLVRDVQFTNTSTTTTKNNINPQFFWNFGDGGTSTAQSPLYTFTRAGVYKVMLAVKDFVPCVDTAYHTIVVDSIPFVNFTTTDSVLCEGQQIIFRGNYLTIGNTGASWTFGDGTMLDKGFTVFHSYDSSGSYVVNLTSHYRLCPDANFSKMINVKPFPRVDIGPDTTLCPNGSPIALIDAVNAGNPNAKFLWNTGDTTSHIIVNEIGTYWALVKLGGCSSTDSITIRKDCYIDIPNSFTPNGDGLNDYFFPRQFLSRSVNAFSMTIFNRWGEIVFQTANIDGRGWDGKFNDKDQPGGAYIYLINVSFSNGAKEKYQGNVTLLR